MFLGLCRRITPNFCLHRAYSLCLFTKSSLCAHLFMRVCCCCPVTNLCPTLCDPMDYSTPGLLWPPLSPGVCSDSCLLSQWCYLTTSSSASSFSSSPQSFPASGSFSMSWLFTPSGQGIEASASVLPMNIQDWFPLGLTGLISLLSKGLSTVFSSTIQNHQFFSTQPSLWSNSYIHT